MNQIKAYFERNYIWGYFASDTSTKESYITMYSIPVSLYSGVNNPVQIFCLNSDQKKIDVSNLSVQMSLFQPNTQNELITVSTSSIDAANGRVIGYFTPSDLSGLEFGMYEIAVTATDGSNVWPVYVDDTYGTRLKTTIQKGPVMAYVDPVSVNFTDVPGVGVVSGQIDLTNRPIHSTLATLQIALNDYTGNVISQATTVSSPSLNDWANVGITSFTSFTGNTFINVPGSFSGIRFIVDGIDPNEWGNVADANITSTITYAVVRT